MVTTTKNAVKECVVIVLYQLRNGGRKQWRQRERNIGGDTEGIKEQLQGIRKKESRLFIGRQRLVLQRAS